MKRTFTFITAAALTGLLACGAAMAARPDGVGPPDNSGGGQGGGKPTTDVYAEMVIVDRDVDGVPIMTDGLGPKDKVGPVPWPIMLGPKATIEDCPLWYEGIGPMPELIPVEEPSVYKALEIPAFRIPFVNYEIPAAYAGCTTEADVGRLSVVRAPDDVLDRALLEMVNTLDPNSDDYDSSITLDAAGRLVVNYIDEGLLVLSKTIDAPAENVAAFQRILEQAELYHDDADNEGAAIDLPDVNSPPDAQGLLDRTAAMFGAAADKFGHVGLDDVIYVTQILTIADDMNADATGLFGLPLSDELGGKYFDFSEFEYDRKTTYAGDVCYLKVLTVGDVAEGGTLPAGMTGEIVKETIMQRVFSNEGFTGNNAYGYAKAVDDARAVIAWTHDHPVPAELIEYCDLPAEK